MKKLLMLLALSSLLLVALAFPASAQDDGPAFTPDGDPTFGMFRISHNFLPDPWIFPVFAGGPVDASAQSIGDDCRGFIGAVPDVNMEWVETSEFNMRIFFVSEGDTTIVVRDPDGTYYCNDDNGLTGDNVTFLDPSVTITSPPVGIYNIWVGTYSSEGFLPGYLMVTEIENTYPGNIINTLLGTMTFATPDE